MNVFFTSDQHFGHENILKFTNENGDRIRPFASVEEMDETMISRWNGAVKGADLVYQLGDFFWGKDKSRMLAVRKRLNGRIHFIPGNHDDMALRHYVNIGFKNFQSWKQFGSHTPPFIACHYPLHLCNLQYIAVDKVRDWKCVHGHIHQRVVLRDGCPDLRYVNVCVERTDYTPVHIDELF